MFFHGHVEYRTGARYYLLRKRDIPQRDRRLSWIARLEGASILVCATCGEIITVIRNRHYHRKVRRKLKWRIQPAGQSTAITGQQSPSSAASAELTA